MTLHQVECFCALAKYRNFTRAAESMYLSQPAFSRVISALEAELGCALFIREKGNPRLSEKGESILPHMTKMLDHYNDLCRLAKLGPQEKPDRGTIVLGVFRFGMLSFLPGMTSAYKAIDPNIRFDMAEHTGVSIFPALKAMDVDLTHTNYIPERFMESLVTLEIGQLSYKAMLPADHPLAGKKNLRPEDLADEFFVGIDRQQFPLMSSRLYSVCANAGFSPNMVKEFDTLTNIFDYISEGRAVTILAAQAPKHPGVAAVPLTGVEPDPTYLVWAKANKKPELLDFLDFVRKRLREQRMSGKIIE